MKIGAGAHIAAGFRRHAGPCGCASRCERATCKSRHPRVGPYVPSPGSDPPPARRRRRLPGSPASRHSCNAPPAPASSGPAGVPPSGCPRSRERRAGSAPSRIAAPGVRGSALARVPGTRPGDPRGQLESPTPSDDFVECRRLSRGEGLTHRGKFRCGGRCGAHSGMVITADSSARGLCASLPVAPVCWTATASTAGLLRRLAPFPVTLPTEKGRRLRGPALRDPVLDTDVCCLVVSIASEGASSASGFHRTRETPSIS